MSKTIAIIGTGIAGLSAAHKLSQNGFNDIIIFEALDRIGGRIHTMPFENGVLELGAQWLHGQHGNPLYSLAKERDLISDPRLDFGIEGAGTFSTDSGQLLNNEDVTQIISCLQRIKEELIENSLESNQLVSAQEIFRLNFENFIKSEECPQMDRQLLWSLFNWFVRYEVIDNSCDDFNELSVLSYSEYEECEGIELINFRDGYQTIIDVLITGLSPQSIRLRTAVKRIEICSKTFKLKLYIEDQNQRKSIEMFDHLIITSSLGFLKKNLNIFFGFGLPQNKINIIRSLGFGTIDKIYLYFDKPFWKSEDQGFQLIWTHTSHRLPVWVYHISGFDLVRGQPKVLVAWIGGKGAKQMEQIDSDQIVGNICADVLRLFLRNRNIENPSKVFRSKWSTNPYICGAYSNRTLEYQKLKCDIEELSEPIVQSKQIGYSKFIDCPLVLFAGEATDKEYYSTTHGAMRSGLREAQRLIQFYEELETKPVYKL